MIDPWELAARWQSAIAAAIGFGGVCLTLWQNARLSRRQTLWLREQTRASVVSAYLAELNVTLEGIVNSIQSVEKFIQEDDKARGLHTFGGRRVHCFERIAFSDTMLLGQDALSKVIIAYATIDRTSIGHKIFGRQHDKDESSVIVDHKAAPSFLSIEKSLRISIEDAIEALERERVLNAPTRCWAKLFGHRRP